jgi:hypothetical protein
MLSGSGVEVGTPASWKAPRRPMPPRLHLRTRTPRSAHAPHPLSPAPLSIRSDGCRSTGHGAGSRLPRLHVEPEERPRCRSPRALLPDPRPRVCWEPGQRAAPSARLRGGNRRDDGGLRPLPGGREVWDSLRRCSDHDRRKGLGRLQRGTARTFHPGRRRRRALLGATGARSGATSHLAPVTASAPRRPPGRARLRAPFRGRRAGPAARFFHAFGPAFRARGYRRGRRGPSGSGPSCTRETM